MHIPRSPVARLIAAGSTVAVVALLIVTKESWAHGALKSSVPAAGAHLDRVPREIRLEFNETAERAFTRIALVGPGGKTVALTPVRIPKDSPRVALASITETLGPGVYTVQWQFGGKDGHPVRGTFKFTIAPGARPDSVESSAGVDSAAMPHHPPTSIPDNPDPAAFDAQSPLFAAIRWLTFLAAFGIVGAAAFRYAVIARVNLVGSAAGLAVVEPALSRAAGIGLAATGLLLVVAIARLYAQSLAMHGPGEALHGEVVATMLSATLWGRAWVLQILGAGLGLVGFVAVRRGRFGGWALVGAASLVVALSLALSGHAPAAPRWSAAVVIADTLHVIGAAGWLGSLFFVLFAGIGAASRLAPEQRGPAVADVANAFSPTALVFAGLAGITGVFAAWIHLQRLDALWTSDYGRTLLLKLAVLSVVAGTGAYNWRRVRPALGDEVGARRVRRSATAEILVAVVVLGITAVLVATGTPSAGSP
ncbi:MAG: CopD family protein [Gemmatimonadaceae bacterium]